MSFLNIHNAFAYFIQTVLPFLRSIYTTLLEIVKRIVAKKNRSETQVIQLQKSLLLVLFASFVEEFVTSYLEVREPACGKNDLTIDDLVEIVLQCKSLSLCKYSIFILSSNGDGNVNMEWASSIFKGIPLQYLTPKKKQAREGLGLKKIQINQSDHFWIIETQII